MGIVTTAGEPSIYPPIDQPDFLDEIIDSGDRNQGNFDDGAWVQEAINAVETSFHERRWVDLPLA